VAIEERHLPGGAVIVGDCDEQTRGRRPRHRDAPERTTTP
jgi:hypothetical protein